MTRLIQKSRLGQWKPFGFLLSSAMLVAQGAPEAQPAAGGPTLQRLEATDPGSGVHYVRLLLFLPATGDAPQPAPPRFTVECRENKGRHELLWFVSFGGIEDPGFAPPFQATQDNLFPPQYPGVNLKMTFEGYVKAKLFTRSWALLPSGELRYRNPGSDSPNMESTRYFLAFLNSLPGLRIVHAKPAGNDPGELVFPSQMLLEELRKTPICAP